MAVHVVKTGDSLSGISHKYGVPIQTIMEVNGLLSTSLIPGLALYLPNKKLRIRYYRIKAGDSIWQLAIRFHTNVSMIIKANPRIDPNRLVIGQKLMIPSPLKLQMTTLGFLAPYSAQTFLSNFHKISNRLTYIGILACSFTDDGTPYLEMDDKEIISRSKQLNVTPLLVIRNIKDGKFNPELAGTVLGNPIYRQKLIDRLVKLARERGYGGVSIDLEFIPPERRNDFLTFLKDLKKGLGELFLHVNVHAKTKDIPTNPLIGAYDYKAIGNIADITAVMTLDYGYPGGPPDPISPIWWMEKVIQYSITVINPKKMQVALPLYGYDKVVSTNSLKALSVQGAQNQAISTGSSIQYDMKAQSPWYSYWKRKEEHIVWFEDIRSYIEKYKLIDYYQLMGTTYWHLSLSAPQNWAYVKNNMAVKK